MDAQAFNLGSGCRPEHPWPRTEFTGGHSATLRSMFAVALPLTTRALRRRLPCRRPILPLIVRELLDVRPVRAHHEQLAVRLWRIGVGHLVLESHARRGEDDLLAVG